MYFEQHNVLNPIILQTLNKNLRFYPTNNQNPWLHKCKDNDNLKDIIFKNWTIFLNFLEVVLDGTTQSNLYSQKSKHELYNMNRQYEDIFPSQASLFSYK